MALGVEAGDALAFGRDVVRVAVRGVVRSGRGGVVSRGRSSSVGVVAGSQQMVHPGTQAPG